MLRIVQVGLGEIGKGIARRVLRLAGLELVGAADCAPGLAGMDLGRLVGDRELGIAVRSSLDELLEETRPDVVLHATGSGLIEVAPQLRPALRRGVSVVSTCEELAFPFYRHPELSSRLDEEARSGGAVLLGTGVNPGFVMDKFVVTLMSACDVVEHVRVSRVVDAATRRESFQRKIGSGLAPSEFERRPGLGHVGLAESAHMLADVMGLGRRRRLRDELRPVLAEGPLATEHLRVEAGQVAGIDQTLTIEEDGVERVRMELQMILGAPRPRDAVAIQGSPALEALIASGVPGDEATAAVAAHCAPLARSLEPGLRTMLDVPLRPGVAKRA